MVRTEKVSNKLGYFDTIQDRGRRTEKNDQK